MADREKVIKGLEICSEHGSWHGLDCEHNEAYKDCPYRGCETGCVVTIAKDAIALLKEQEAVEPTIDKYGNKRCGNCGHKLQSIADMDLFCCKCGRQVKWE